MQSNSKLMSRLFTVLMRRTVLPGFVFRAVRLRNDGLVLV